MKVLGRTAVAMEHPQSLMDRFHLIRDKSEHIGSWPGQEFRLSRATLPKLGFERVGNSDASPSLAAEYGHSTRTHAVAGTLMPDRNII